MDITTKEGAPMTRQIEERRHGRVGFDPLAYDLIAIVDEWPPEDANAADTVLQIGNGFEDPNAGWSASGLTDEADALIASRAAAKPRRCDHCGKSMSRIRFVAYARHRESGEVVQFGHTCGQDLGYEDRFQLAIAHARRAAETAKQTAKRNAERDAWNAEHPDEAAVLDRIDAGAFADNEFLVDLARARRVHGALTDRQTEFVVEAERRAIEREERRIAREAEDAERLANAPVLEAGRREVTGRFAMTRYQESDFGSTLKGLFLIDDGNKLWGTVPRAVEDAAFAENYRQIDAWRRFGQAEHVRERGERDDFGAERIAKLVAEIEAEGELREAEPDEVDDLIKRLAVTMTVAIEPKDGDEHFGFYKRPTKVRTEWAEEEGAR